MIMLILALIAGKYKIKFDGLYFGAFLIDISIVHALISLILKG